MSTSARRDVVAAVVAILAEAGFEGLSLRSVASRAGVSLGAVQHHFPTKAQMVTAALTSIAAEATQRLGELEQIPDPGERLHALVERLLPSSGDSLVARIWLSLAARATVDEEAAAAYADLWGRTRAGLRLLLPAAGAPVATAEDDATELLALLDGLALGVVAEAGRMDPEQARRIAHRRVEELLRQPTARLADDIP
ncbi:TetR/AcrR family transcriptional regulator [Ornithinimicrobium avium]|uniref:TetR/AcrR family transcriptional regulator n=1 Tax=Ornithinimicrobium avium TaxID=2283195 RepID=A0A345NNQ0_9MICO|nr:TetR/AcrR family transcriptional regulator [Ornithinimicrobium avium]AXH96658.1 TetR/AcrR family transcriptional regulator [Ornithinimicrobium avium]